MQKILLILLVILSSKLQGQNVAAYFEKIRDNTAALTAFFSQMPKGGDLHHHFTGSIYAETYLNAALKKDFFIHVDSLLIAEAPPAGNTNWKSLSHLKRVGLLDEYKQKLLQKWSAKDFKGDYPSHRQFFESFNHFGPAVKYSIEDGIEEIKARALKENVQYIETTLRSVTCEKDISDLEFLNERLLSFQTTRNLPLLKNLLDSIYDVLQKKNLEACVRSFNAFLNQLHTAHNMDDSTFAMRYQAPVNRGVEPIPFFKNLIIAFEAANTSPLVVGVNILGPEHYEISMRDYWLQMQMFNYCHTKYPTVKYSLHAGELTTQLAKPEDLTWHISSAVYDAKANRIGHGIDVPDEADCYSLLDYMSKNKIAVEINLASNDFILNIKDDKHPILLYKYARVPIVIATDDAGILRTNLTEQFVLLTKRYKEISYSDIKQMIYNSIHYSFIKDAGLKNRLKARVDSAFVSFEKKVMAFIKK